MIQSRMSLAAGTRLGPYELVAAIGAGGMGEVYKARDTRLDRFVAIKVLPAALASDPQFRERFEREARSISALNHPNICALYDVGRQDSSASAGPAGDFLVMEYLEGETLAARLSKGALPLADALRTATEIASALDAAHRRGIVHRDLKPGNVMLTKAGAKLLDFGLAKVGPVGEVSGVSTMPTMTGPLTARGTILGTFQYMAPEQVEGQEVDARGDIFAFGAVLFEMLTGRRAFQGTSQASLLGAILKDEPPPVSQLQPVTPPALDHVVKTCLAKDREDRFQTAHDLRLQLRWIAEGGSGGGLPVPVVAHRRQRERWAWIALGVVTALWLITLRPAMMFVRSPPEARQVQFLVPTPNASANSPVSVSPDGQLLAYAAPQTAGSPPLLLLRPLSTPQAQMVPGTEGVFDISWSPKGDTLAFAVPGKLKRVDVAGGAPRDICDWPSNSFNGATWSTDDVIVFSSGGVLYRVAAAGGRSAALGLAGQATDYAQSFYPWFLPDGRHFLYLDLTKHGIYVGALDAAPPTLLVTGESKPIFVPPASKSSGQTGSGPGWLVHQREGAPFAQPFDAQTLKIQGEPTRIADDVAFSRYRGSAALAVSANGVLVYRRFTPLFPMVDLAWFNRAGTPLGVIGDPARDRLLRLSPDDQRVALSRLDDADNADIWTIDLSSGVKSKLTTDGVANDTIWSPPGSRPSVIFWSLRQGKTDFYQQTLGSNDADLVYESPEDQKWPDDVSPDGQHLLFHRNGQLFSLPLQGPRTPRLLGDMPPLIDEAHFSPDGRWIAFGSTKTGPWQTYVASFPAFDHIQQVSNGGGSQPHWRGDNKELFYLAPDGKVMSVTVQSDTTAAGTLRIGPPRVLFQSPIPVPDMTVGQYDVTKDGQRFLFIQPRPADVVVVPPMTVVLNWMTGLKK